MKWLWELDGRRPDRDRAHALPRPLHRVRQHPGRLRHGAAGSAPPARPASSGSLTRRRDRRAGGAGPARAAARDDPRRVSNVVFMGMGEPLANYDRTWAAVERLHGDMGISARHLTISTVGIVPGIRRLAGEAPAGQPGRVAARRQRRAARRARADQPPLPARRAGRRLRATYLDGQEPAAVVRVGAHRRRQRPAAATPTSSPPTPAPLRAHVNLIPLNPTPGYATRGTPPGRVAAFRDLLRVARRQRHRAPEPGHRHRRRLRPAPGRPRGRGSGRRAQPVRLSEPPTVSRPAPATASTSDLARRHLRRRPTPPSRPTALDHVGPGSHHRSDRPAPSTTAPGSTTIEPSVRRAADRGAGWPAGSRRACRSRRTGRRGRPASSRPSPCGPAPHDLVEARRLRPRGEPTSAHGSSDATSPTPRPEAGLAVRPGR